MVDFHAHPPLAMTYLGRDPSRRGSAPALWNPLQSHWDVPRAREGGVDVQAFTVYTPIWPLRRLPHPAEARRNLDVVDGWLGGAGRFITRLGKGEDLDGLDGSRIGVVVALEGGHSLGGRPEMVDELARRGIVYLTLTHFVDNGLLRASEHPLRHRHEPLTELGREVLRRLSVHRVLPDVAHASRDAIDRVFEETDAPVISSHTGVQTLCDIERNLADRHIDEIARRGGVVGIIAWPPYLERGLASRGSLRRMVDHIEYVARRAGCAHVGLGTDFDGAIWTGRGLADVRALPRVTEALLARGFDATEVEQVMGGNWIRLLREYVWGSVRSC